MVLFKVFGMREGYYKLHIAFKTGKYIVP